MAKLQRYYYSCMKMFLGYSKFYSVTNMLIQLLQLAILSTVVHNNNHSFNVHWTYYNVVNNFKSIAMYWFQSVYTDTM